MRTLYRWLENEKDFAATFELAKAEGRAALEDRALALAEKDDGKHALELLSRRYPKAWGRQDRLKADVSVTDVSRLTPNEARQLLVEAHARSTKLLSEKIK